MAASYYTSDLCGAGSRIVATGLFELHETEFELWNNHERDDWSFTDMFLLVLPLKNVQLITFSLKVTGSFPFL